MIRLAPVPRDRLEEIWPSIAGLIEQAYRATDAAFDPDHLLDEGRDGRRQFWTITDDRGFLAAMETQVVGRRIIINALAGTDMQRWLRPAERQLIDIATSHGLTSIELDGRLGWQRLLPDYRVARVTLRKDIRHG